MVITALQSNKLLVSTPFFNFGGISSTCSKPKVHSILHNYKALNTSVPGILDSASATIFSLPLMCSIVKSNWDRKSNQRAFLRDTFYVECR